MSERIDFTKYAGKSIEVEFENKRGRIQEGAFLVVATRWPTVKPGGYLALCDLCGANVALSLQDKPTLAEQTKVQVLCPDCFRQEEKS
jgi:hypothetical protein